MQTGCFFWAALILLALAAPPAALQASLIRIATYNVENYLDQPTATRPHAKSATAKAKVCESIQAMRPDVLALQEMGGTNELLTLRDALQAGGQTFPFWALGGGADTNIHVAVLSKLPILAHPAHTNDYYLLDGRRLAVRREFVELELKAGANFTFTLLVAHLKSRLPTPEADQAVERQAEARVLRHLIDTRLAREPDAKLVVLGDFNDTRDSGTLKELIGRGQHRLWDTRPAERNGDTARSEPPYFEPRDVAWTYFYGKEDTYSRIDYILLSPALKRLWRREETYIPAVPNWGVASDHRPIVAGFETGEN